MTQIVYESDPLKPVYKDELREVLTDIENRIKDIESKHNVIIAYNVPKYPNEISCAIISTTFKL